VADTAHSAGARGERVATAKGDVERIELGKRGQASARRAAESKATVPHAYLTRTVAAEGEPARLQALVAAAVGRALRDCPELNAAYRDGAIERYGRRNLALTVELDEGTLTPTLFDADLKQVDEIAAEIDRLVTGARAGTLASPELSGGTFTLSFLAAGADAVAPPVTPGQAAHLGVGRPRSGPAIREGAVVATQLVGLTLSIDQRAVHPGAAASFLERVATTVETSRGDGL
jgi:pyruvate/2-oxoglutarate dehydrogenase complex dihydrolipoamide acyltransferase (E2) component